MRLRARRALQHGPRAVHHGVLVADARALRQSALASHARDVGKRAQRRSNETRVVRLRANDRVRLAFDRGTAERVGHADRFDRLRTRPRVVLVVVRARVVNLRVRIRIRVRRGIRSLRRLRRRRGAAEPRGRARASVRRQQSSDGHLALGFQRVDLDLDHVRIEGFALQLFLEGLHVIRRVRLAGPNHELVIPPSVVAVPRGLVVVRRDLGDTARRAPRAARVAPRAPGPARRGVLALRPSARGENRRRRRRARLEPARRDRRGRRMERVGTCA